MLSWTLFRGLLLAVVLFNEADALRARKTCTHLGRKLCTRGGVSVLLSPHGTNERLLQFGEECGVETKVHCQGALHQDAGICSGQCDACPCSFDASRALTTPYMQTMFDQMQRLCATNASTRILSIGLGGGELPQFLLRKCPTMSVEAVELNADVIDVARKYFGLGDSEQEFTGRLTVEQADALAAVQERADTAPGSFDSVLVDCFAGKGIVPETCRSASLAQSVQALLKPGGMLLQNIWHFSPNVPEVAADFKETTRTYSNTFSEAQVEVLDVPMPQGLRWVNIIKATK